MSRRRIADGRIADGRIADGSIADGPAVTRFEPRPLPYALGLSTLMAQSDFVFTAEGIPVQGQLVAPVASEAGRLATLHWTLGSVAGELVLPARVASRLLRAIEPQPQGEIDAATAALLLELALAEPVRRLEAACSEAVQLTRFVQSTAESGPSGAEALVIGVAALFDGEPFKANLRAPPAAMALFQRLAASRPAAGRIDPPVALAVRLGLARLDQRLLHSLEIGDAVVLQQPSEDRVVVVVGERLAALGRLDGSRVTLDAPPRRAAETAMGMWLMSESNDMTNATGENPSGENATRENAAAESVAPADASLQDLQVTLVFELARRPATLQEVRAFVAGHVIELGPLAEQRISVLANGARVGEGELVRVGDATAVRLTRLAAG